MKYFDSYHLPTTLDEALKLLAEYQGHARVVAGGTDLLLDLSSDYIEGQRPHYAALVDVTRLQGANEIQVGEEWVVIGCGVTHTQIAESPTLARQATALVEACALIGGPQVRNVATLVGNIAHGLPAADGTVALMALGAEAEIQNSEFRILNSAAWRPLSSLFLGPGQSAVDSSREIITAVRFRPVGAGEGSAFARVMRPQGVALPILGMAAKLKAFQISDFRFQIQEAAISAGPVAPVPFRASRTEAYLTGKVLTDEVLAEAQRILVVEAHPRTSPHRATKEYRVELMPALLAHVVMQAMARASAR
ncbi:MAG: FAD binding domain-containing protein [Anaerolineae bacterium]